MTEQRKGAREGWAPRVTAELKWPPPSYWGGGFKSLRRWEAQPPRAHARSFFLPAQNFDLFGDPVAEHGPRGGRPPHIATQENRNKVSMLLAFGWNNERIARAIHVTPKTLRRRYFPELRFRDEARDRLDATLAMNLWRQVEAGNVSAMREFRDLVEHNDLMLLGGQRRPEPKQPKLGKKEALLAAQKPDLATPAGRLMAEDFGKLN